MSTYLTGEIPHVLLTSPTVLTTNTGSQATTYTDAAVGNGSLYFYQVTPVISASASLISPAKSYVVAAYPVNIPPGVLNLSVTNYSAGVPKLTWTIPSTNGGANIIGYRIQRSSDNQNWSSDLAPISFEPSYIDATVTLGQIY